jgi:ubiquinone/menaquinone biosynthesis C-methylase UbiE
LGWENILKSSKNLRILDLGCGDGDVIQNFMEFASNTLGDKLEEYKIEIIGADLSESRLLNAQKLVGSFGENIEITFVKVDLTYGIQFEDDYFDAVLCTGVLEILEQDLFLKTISEICRVTRTFIYIEDLFEKFPGGYPRTDQGRYFMAKSFLEEKYILTFTEPISQNGLSDPMQIWPIMAVQNSFYIKSS